MKGHSTNLQALLKHINLSYLLHFEKVMVLTSRYNFVFLSFFSPLLMRPGLERIFCLKRKAKFSLGQSGKRKERFSFHIPGKLIVRASPRPPPRLSIADDVSRIMSTSANPKRKRQWKGPRRQAPRSLRRSPSGQCYTFLQGKIHF
jgi:hypothetical protein